MKEIGTFKHFCIYKPRFFIFSLFGRPGQKLRDLWRVRDLKLHDLSRVEQLSGARHLSLIRDRHCYVTIHVFSKVRSIGPHPVLECSSQKS